MTVLMIALFAWTPVLHAVWLGAVVTGGKGCSSSSMTSIVTPGTGRDRGAGHFLLAATGRRRRG